MTDPFGQFRDSSKKVAGEFFRKFSQALVDRARWINETAEKRADELQTYFRSEEFERDLDRFAERLGVDDPRYPITPEERSERVKAKVEFLLHHARHEVALAAEQGGAFGLLSRRPRVIAGLAAVCGGIRAGMIGMEAYRVFAPAKRRGRLRVVEIT